MPSSTIVRRSLLLTLALVVGGWSHLIAQQTAAPVPARNTADENAYLLGLVGTAHVIVLHDYLGLLNYRAEVDTNGTAVDARLKFVSNHCAKLLRLLNGATPLTPVATEAETSEFQHLMGMVQQECTALQTMLDNPTGEAIANYEAARSALEDRLRKLASTGETRSESSSRRSDRSATPGGRD